MRKPAYSLTRQAFWLSFAFAWGLIFWICFAALHQRSAEAVTLANIIIPSMVMMIAALLGIHRAFGALDMRTLAAAAAPPEPAAPKDAE
jgi:hypothetical protein